jgi:protein gp37
MANSSIEWTEVTWNPTTGCDKISAGCKFCYAEVMSKRLQSMRLSKYQNGFELTIHADTLTIPYTWKKPRIVFVNSMSDLFHKNIPLDFIQEVFRVMKENHMHTFQVLTKRADILAQYNSLLDWAPNIWMGVSVENQNVIERIDYLRYTGAFIKFLSLEPLIGPLQDLNLHNIDWVIVGGESGPKARPMKKDWVLDIKDQCDKADVKFFFKQWGGFNKKKAGRQLEGNIYNEMPV